MKRSSKEAISKAISGRTKLTSETLADRCSSINRIQQCDCGDIYNLHIQLKH